MTKDEFLNSEKEMNEFIENLNRNIVSGKQKKFQRDQLAFAINRAYKLDNDCRVNKRFWKENKSMSINVDIT